MESGRILVFGASGMVGLHTVEFFRSKGWEVVGVVRSGSLDKRPWAKRFLSDVELVIGDVRDPGLEDKLLGLGRFDLAVNTVAVLSNRREAYEVNALGAGRAARAGSRLSSHVVFISAILALGDALREGTGEDIVCRPRTLFERSKCDGERLSREAAVEAGVKWSILRPVWITGEYSLNPDMPRLARIAARLGVAPVFSGSLLQLVYVRDVVSAVYSVYEGGAVGVFNVAWPNPPSMKVLPELLGRALSKKVRGLPVPGLFASLGSRFNPALRFLALRPGPVVVDKLVGLGWSPRVDPGEAVRRLVAWMRSEGLL